MSTALTVSVVILTQRRPGPLLVAARSVLRQAGVADIGVELVVVDNDARPSARGLVEGLAAEAAFPVRYVHEPRAGVANARNAAVAATNAPWIAFLDDDEEASDGWLAALLAARRRFGADVVFGPVRGRAPASVTEHRAYLEWFFSRVGPAEAKIIDAPFGCGDSLIRRGAMPNPDAPFSTATNETGGEDDVLFGAMKAAGAVFAWAPGAWVYEDPAPARLTLRYALTRAFIYGQSPPYHAANASPRQAATVIKWMLVGAAQLGVFGLAAAGKWLIHAPNRAFMFDRAARGLGKILWFGPFKFKLYGQTAALAAAPRPPRSASRSPFWA